MSSNTEKLVRKLVNVYQHAKSVDQNLVVIMRGLPGSGKTYLVKKTMEELEKIKVASVSCSTDDFFFVDGIYTFDASKLKENHEFNLIKFSSKVKEGVPVIFVDNTNIARHEYSQYAKVAKESDRGYIVTVFDVPEATNIELCLERNTHGVSKEVLERRYKQYDVARPVYVGAFFSKETIQSHLPEWMIKNEVEDQNWMWVTSPHITFEFCANVKDSKWRASDQWIDKEDTEFGSEVSINVTKMFKTRNTLSLHGTLTCPKSHISSAYRNTQSVHITVAVREPGLAVESGVVHDRLCRGLGAEVITVSKSSDEFWDETYSCGFVSGSVKHCNVHLNGVFLYMF